MKYYTFGVDANEIQQAMVADKLASKVSSENTKHCCSCCILFIQAY